MNSMVKEHYYRRAAGGVPDCCGVCKSSKFFNSWELFCMFGEAPDSTPTIDLEVGQYFICDAYERMTYDDIENRYDV